MAKEKIVGSRLLLTLKNLFKALLGAIFIFVVHLPRLTSLALLSSYYAVFNNRPTLTANPAEHLKRARRILKRGKLSELLYAAVEIRFALERIVQRDMLFADKASNRMREEYDPIKQISNLRKLYPDSEFQHEVYIINRATGERTKWEETRPIRKSRAKEIKGRLGDILHPKWGIPLGMPDDPWYTETKTFLAESIAYLDELANTQNSFFYYDGLELFERVRK